MNWKITIPKKTSILFYRQSKQTQTKQCYVHSPVQYGASSSQVSVVHLHLTDPGQQCMENK